MYKKEESHEGSNRKSSPSTNRLPYEVSLYAHLFPGKPGDELSPDRQLIWWANWLSSRYRKWDVLYAQGKTRVQSPDMLVGDWMHAIRWKPIPLGGIRTREPFIQTCLTRKAMSSFRVRPNCKKVPVVNNETELLSKPCSAFHESHFIDLENRYNAIFNSLTTTERQVVEYLLARLTRAQIAHLLGMKEHQVHYMIKCLKRKFYSALITA